MMIDRMLTGNMQRDHKATAAATLLVKETDYFRHRQ